MDFTRLSETISTLDNSLRGAAAVSINCLLTMRNWLIGMYIVEYEQNGEDRAAYGGRLLRTLSVKLVERGIRGMSFTNLNLFRQFYRTYPQIIHAASEFFRSSIQQEMAIPIIQTLSEQLAQSSQQADNKSVTKNAVYSDPQQLLRHFSFSHFIELMRITDPLKRAFYEIEGVNGCWSVSQLKRQIESLLYERTGLSADKKGIVKKAHEQNSRRCSIRSSLF